MADEDEVVFADLGQLAAQCPATVARELNRILRGVLRQTGEVHLPPGWADENGDEDVVLSLPLGDGGVKVWATSRVRRDDPRVPAGGWIQASTGIAVHVEGISYAGNVIVRHMLDEPDEHRADEDVESFLARHVRADAVPLIGGE